MLIYLLVFLFQSFNIFSPYSYGLYFQLCYFPLDFSNELTLPILILFSPDVLVIPSLSVHMYWASTQKPYKENICYLYFPLLILYSILYLFDIHL